MAMRTNSHDFWFRDGSSKQWKGVHMMLCMKPLGNLGVSLHRKNLSFLRVNPKPIYYPLWKLDSLLNFMAIPACVVSEPDPRSACEALAPRLLHVVVSNVLTVCYSGHTVPQVYCIYKPLKYLISVPICVEVLRLASWRLESFSIGSEILHI